MNIIQRLLSKMFPYKGLEDVYVRGDGNWDAIKDKEFRSAHGDNTKNVIACNKPFGSK